MVTCSTEDVFSDSGKGESLDRTITPEVEPEPKPEEDSVVDTVEQTVREMTVKKTPPPRPPFPPGVRKKSTGKCLLPYCTIGSSENLQEETMKSTFSVCMACSYIPVFRIAQLPGPSSLKLSRTTG